jgi:biopolymer transport protein ExbB/TolQ
MMTTQVALDAFVAVLLLATIIAAWRLDRRLSTLRREKAALAELMADFGQAAAKADQGLKSLKAAANDVGRDVEALVAKGQGLREDLSFLIERGEPLADRLTDAIRARQAAPPSPSAAAPATAARSAVLRQSSSRDARATAPVGAGAAVEPRSEIERELLKALAALR